MFLEFEMFLLLIEGEVGFHKFVRSFSMFGECIRSRCCPIEEVVTLAFKFRLRICFDSSFGVCIRDRFCEL